jgi:hypothetical protein
MAITSTAQLSGKERYFTDDDRAKYDYLGGDYSSILFRISHEMMFKRSLPEARGEQVNTKKGQVSFENGRAVEYYQIKDNATATFESISADKKSIIVRFGNDQDEVIKFTQVKGSGNDSKMYYTLVLEPGKKLNFLGYSWDFLSTENVRLVYKGDNDTKLDFSKTKSKGMKLDGTERKSIIDKIKGN